MSFGFTVWVSLLESPRATNVLEVTLAALALDTDEIEEGSEENTVVGNLGPLTNGSTIELTDSAGNRFKLGTRDGSTIPVLAGPVATDHSAATSHNITVRETHPDGNNSPRDSVVGITVTDGEAVPFAQFIERQASTANQQTYTFSTSFGEASADQYLLVAVSGRHTAATLPVVRALTTGDSEIAVGVVKVQNINVGFEAHFLIGPINQASGKIEVAFDSDGQSPLRCAIAVWRLEKPNTTATDTTTSALNNAEVSATIDVAAGGAAVASFSYTNASDNNVAWSPDAGNERYDHDIESGIGHSGWSQSYVSSQTDLVVTATRGGTPGNTRMCASTWAPAA